MKTEILEAKQFIWLEGSSMKIEILEAKQFRKISPKQLCSRLHKEPGFSPSPWCFFIFRLLTTKSLAAFWTPHLGNNSHNSVESSDLVTQNILQFIQKFSLIP